MSIKFCDTNIIGYRSEHINVEKDDKKSIL